MAPVAECNPPALQGERTILLNRDMLINQFCMSLFLISEYFPTCFFVCFFFSLFHAENQATPQEEIMFLFEKENTSGNHGFLDVYKPECLLSENFQSKHQIPSPHCGCFTVPKWQHLEGNAGYCNTFS